MKKLFEMCKMKNTNNANKRSDSAILIFAEQTCMM